MNKTIIYLTLALAAGCGERAEVWKSALEISGPFEVAGQVLWVDGTRGRVLALSMQDGEPRVRGVGIRRNATFVLPSPNGEDLLVITGGKEALLKEQEPEEPGLSVVKPGSSGIPALDRFYPLSGAFDRLAVSPDGRFAVATYSSSQTDAGVFRNPNEVALLDLGRPPGGDNPTLRTVRSFGSAPLGVIFSPEMAPVGAAGGAPSGTKRTLAVVLAENYLTFLDLSNPGRREITVPLAKPDAVGTIRPRQVHFSPATGTVFVRADGAADIYSLTLLAQPAAAATDNDYLPSINQPSAGKTALDMILFSDGGQDQILTVNASQELALIDAATSQFVIIPVGERVDRILAVPEESPTLALIYSQAQPAPRIHFLELKDLAKNLGQNLTSRNLDRPVHQIVAMPEGAQALVVHNDKRTVVSILDLLGAHHTVSPIQGQLPLASFDFLGGTQGSFLVGVTAGLKQVGLLELDNLHPTNLRLDHDPREVLVAGETIIVDHQSPQGLVTVIPGPRADREAGRVLWGFLVSDLLDDELKD